MNWLVVIGYMAAGVALGLAIVGIWKGKEIRKEIRAIRAHTASLWESTHANNARTLELTMGTIAMTNERLRNNTLLIIRKTDEQIMAEANPVDVEVERQRLDKKVKDAAR